MAQAPHHYDFIIAGAGAAGLSLACQLTESALRAQTVLIIDREPKRQNDHTWCFWTAQPTWLDAIAYRVWEQARFIGAGRERAFELAPYRYQMIRGLDYYDLARRKLADRPNVHWAQGTVQAIEDGEQAARVTAGNETWTGTWVFDSRFDGAEFHPDPARYHYLKQHFKGWVLEADHPAFDSGLVTLFDFRTPQRGAMRFFYVLPFSPTQALVEYTLFSAELLPPAEYTAALRAYVETQLGLRGYTLLEEEQGVIPMTDYPFSRRGGRHIVNIGTRGGRVKPSTGYAFWRIQQDAAATVAALEESGQPFAVRAAPARYRLLDRLMLQQMFRHGEEMERLFADLFMRNSIDRIFGFLDETAKIGENLQLLLSLPPWPFIRAWLRLQVLRQV